MESGRVAAAWGQWLPAPAKINLFLHVLGRRADGYHSLQTAFRFLDFGDSLRFEPRDDGEITRETELPGVAVEVDLTVRAARLLQRETGVRVGARISVIKRLPMGGGLGGGSSDAATTLLALNALWQTKLTRTQLQELGLQLGADVPVFVFGRNAFAEGVGERLLPIELEPAWYLVVEPGVSVPTREIFADPGLTRHSNPIKIADFSSACHSLAALRNDLEPAVRARYAVVDEVLRWLCRYDAGLVRMSGSGACVFAQFASEKAARAVLEVLPSAWRGWVAPGLDEHPLQVVSAE